MFLNHNFSPKHSKHSIFSIGSKPTRRECGLPQRGHLGSDSGSMVLQQSAQKYKFSSVRILTPHFWQNAGRRRFFRLNRISLAITLTVDCDFGNTGFAISLVCPLSDRPYSMASYAPSSRIVSYHKSQSPDYVKWPVKVADRNSLTDAAPDCHRGAFFIMRHAENIRHG